MEFNTEDIARCSTSEDGLRIIRVNEIRWIGKLFQLEVILSKNYHYYLPIKHCNGKKVTVKEARSYHFFVLRGAIS